MAEPTVPVRVSLIEVRDLRPPFDGGRCHCGHAASSHNTLGYCLVYGNRAPSTGDCTCGAYEDARSVAWRAGRDAAVALLSQPTPTAEPDACPRCGGTGEVEDDSHRHTGLPTVGRCGLCGGSGRVTAEPPRIEDMAPGTTFVGTLSPTRGSVAEPRTRRLFVTVGPDLYDERGLHWYEEDVDPSTIRDVTPPKEA